MSVQEDTKKAIEMGNKIADSFDFIYDKYARPTFEEEYIGESPQERQVDDVRSYNIGKSNYSDKKIQPWDIWEEYNLNPWDADIVKRILRTKDGERRLDYEKIIHICKKRIHQLDNDIQV